MNKQVYTSPEVEKMDIRLEQNFLDSTKSSTSVENATYFDNEAWD